MKKCLRRIIAIIMSLLLCLTSITISAIANDDEPVAVSTAAELNQAISNGSSLIAVFGKIELTQTLTLVADASIYGGDEDAELAGNGTFALIHSEAKNLALKDIKLSGGNSAVGGYFDGEGMCGGAVASTTGAVYVENVIFENNTSAKDGGAIYTWVNITLINSTFIGGSAAQRGGAILSAGAIDATGCTFTNNTAAWFGGAVFTYFSPITMDKCTFTGNSVTAPGSTGGAIRNDSGVTTISNSTFTSNTTPGYETGGAVSAGGNVTISDTKFEKNVSNAGAAIFVPNKVTTLTNVEFVSNTAIWGPCAYVVAGGVVKGTVSCLNNVDTGGAGDFANGGGVVNVSYVVTSEETLRAAVNAGISQILIGKDITLTSTLVLKATTTFIGNNTEENYTLSGDGTFCLINYGTYGVTVKNLNLKNGGNIGSFDNCCGGALSGTASDVIAIDCNFTNNSANNGAAIYCWQAVTATNCTFENNIADVGGAIYAAGLTTLSNCTFKNNSAQWFGGAIWQNAMSGIIANDCSFEGNTVTATSADVAGGAIAIETGDANLTNCTFKGNGTINTTDSKGGGAFYCSGSGKVEAFLCVFEKNYSLNGAAVYSNGGGTLLFNGCSFIDNSNSVAGGTDVYSTGMVSLNDAIKTEEDLSFAISKGVGTIIIDGEITLTKTICLSGDTKISGVDSENPAKLTGNGSFVLIEAGSHKLTLSNIKLSNGYNAAGNGGAINSSSDVIATNCIFENNYANGYGGAIAEEGTGTLRIAKCNFIGNTALNDGSCIYNASGTGITAVLLCDYTDNTGANTIYCVNPDCPISEYEVETYSQLAEAVQSKIENIVIAASFNIVSSITLQGPTNITAKTEGLTLSGTKSCGLFIAGDNDLSITGLTLTKGKAANGAAIYIENGMLQVKDCAFINNEATVSGGAIYSTSGKVELQNTSFVENKAADSGGALYLNSLQANCTLDSLTFTENTAGNVGGAVVFIDGTLELSKCHLSKNKVTGAEAVGGGVFVSSGKIILKDSVLNENVSQQGNGGAAFIMQGDIEVYGSTLHGNQANLGGALFASVGNISTAQKSIFSENSATVDAGGAICTIKGNLVLEDTRFMANTAVAIGGAVMTNEGIVTVKGCNFTSNTTSATGAGIFCASDIIVSDSTFTSNSANMGGAIGGDKGIISITGSKINGNKATVIGGAVSAESAAITIKDSEICNNESSSGAGVYVKYPEASLVIDNSVISSNIAEYDGGGILTMDAPVQIINKSVISGNKAINSNGGGIYAQTGAITIFDSAIENNLAGLGGGGIFSDKSDITIQNTTFSSNSAKNESGGVAFVTNANLKIDSSKFTSNKSGVSGGAILIVDGSILINNCEFKKNDAGLDGGTIAVVNIDLNISNSKIADSTAAGGNGGAIYCGKGNLHMTASQIENCQTKVIGGGIFMDAGTAYISKSIIRGCSAKEDAGGGVCALTGDVHIAGGEMNENKSNKSGGAILADTGKVVIDDATFTGNFAVETGGALFAKEINVTNTTFNSNNANMGGAVGVWQSNLTIEKSKFTGNTSTEAGGAIYGLEGNINLKECEFEENTTENSGGAVYFDGKENLLLVDDSIFKANVAEVNGGAIIGISGRMIANNTRFIMNKVTLYNGGAVFFLEGEAEYNGCSFTLNTAKDLGGALFSDAADFTINAGNVFSGNTATKGSGGAVCLISGDLVVTGSEFSQNVCGETGGAIINCDGKTTVTDCSFSTNTAAVTAGAVFNNTALLVVRNCKASSNNAALGGVLGTGDSNMEVYDCQFNGNSANIVGGALYANYGNIYVENCELSGNKCYDTGGVFYTYNGKIEVVNSTIERNNTNANGGVVSNTLGETEFTNCKINSNESGLGGGVVHTTGSAPITFTGCTISKNKAGTEGGVVFAFASPVTIENCQVTNNSAEEGNGGAFDCQFSSFNIINSTFTENSCTGFGGALYGNTMNISGSDFSLSSADLDGGAIFCSGLLKLSDTSFDENESYEGRVVFVDSIGEIQGDDQSKQSLDENEQYNGTFEAPSEEEPQKKDNSLIFIIGGAALAVVVLGIAILIIVKTQKKKKVKNENH